MPGKNGLAAQPGETNDARAIGLIVLKTALSCQVEVEQG
jgi:hypothetical protein